MTRINNVNVEALEKAGKEFKEDPKKAKKTHCYTATFATVASQLGITLKKLATKVEAEVNFSRVFGLGDDPVIEEVRVTLFVESDVPEEKIREAEELARQRCPVVYTLTNPVKLTARAELAPGDGERG